MHLLKKNLSVNPHKIIGILLVAFLVISPNLFGQQQKPAKPGAISIPEPLKRMEKLMGKWEGTINSETGPVVTKKELKTSFDFSRMFKNLAVKVTTRFAVIDTPQVTEGNIIIGYDATNDQLHALMMDDQGEAYDLVGKWMNDYNLNFSCNTERGGKKIGITIWMNIKVADELGYKMYRTIGENLLITDEGKLKRKKTEATGTPKKAPVKK